MCTKIKSFGDTGKCDACQDAETSFKLRIEVGILKTPEKLLGEINEMLMTLK